MSKSEATTKSAQYYHFATDDAQRVIERYIETRLTDSVIVSTRSIYNAVDDDLTTDVSQEQLGKTLKAMVDEHPKYVSPTVDVDIWRDTSPTKWVITRLEGEPATPDWKRRPSRKAEIIREIAVAVDEPYEDSIRGNSPRSKNVRIRFKRTVVAAIAEQVGTEPSGELEKMSQKGLTATLERLLDIDSEGSRETWNKAVMETIWDVLVDGQDLTEVAR